MLMNEALWWYRFDPHMRSAAKKVAAAIAVATISGSAMAQGPQPQAAAEFDLCRQQLSASHNALDQQERNAYMALQKAATDAEAREATLIVWLKKAQEDAVAAKK